MVYTGHTDPLCNTGVWVGGEGQSAGLSAEVNVGGKVIYAYNWKLRHEGEGPGHYRITFSLDALHGDVPLNTYFTTTEIWGFEETERGEPEGGVPVIDHALNLSYIDVEILSGTGNANGGPGGEGGHGRRRKPGGTM